MTEAIIVKGLGGLYTVYQNGQMILCKARGRFRNENLRPEIGDFVRFTPPEPGHDFGYITEVLPRKSLLKRPSAANIEVLFVTICAKDPEPDLLLADKLIIGALQSGIQPDILINKKDLGDCASLAAQYSLSGYDPVIVSSITGDGIEALKLRMSGRVCAFGGQSGVGKSSVLNALFSKDMMETGDISRINRGRHTTRHVELLRLEEIGAWVADTPGFSLLEADSFDPEELKDYYPEFEPYEGECRFQGCSHITEPGCAVINAMCDGLLSRERLERYARIYEEIKEKWRKRYD